MAESSTGLDPPWLETRASVSEAETSRTQNSKSKKSRSPGTRRHDSNSTKHQGPASSSKRSPEGHIMIGQPPSPLQNYLDMAGVDPVPLRTSQSLLIILDLNGTLILRDRTKPQVFQPRPGLNAFLEYIFKEHSVMIWTSMTPKNMHAILPRVFKSEQTAVLTAAWARDSLELTSWQYANKVQVYKRLHKVWNQQGSNLKMVKGCPRWSQENTILIDDSILKASSEPYNLINIPKFEENNEGEKDAKILGQVVEYIKEAAKWSNISAYMKQTPFHALAPTATSTSQHKTSPDLESNPVSLDAAFGKLALERSVSGPNSPNSAMSKLGDH